ncbi:uncharacterized protein DS421_20g689490 [Arachis hypogaea]|nr:uncharacterized protein DS421_20g689490 [Arachis hypogaea]
MSQVILTTEDGSVAVGTTVEASVLGFSQYPLVHYRCHILRVRVVSTAAKVKKAGMQAAGDFGLRERVLVTCLCYGYAF